MASAPPDSMVCNACRAINPPGAHFCGACGGQALTPLAALGPPPPGMAPPVIPPAGPPPMPGMGGPPPFPTMPAGTMSMRAPVMLDLPLPDAFNRAAGAVQSTGATITTQSPPAAFGFSKTYKNIWWTASLSVRYDGSVTLVPESDHRTAASVQMAVDKGSMTTVLAVSAVTSIIVVIFFSILIGLIGLVVLFFVYQHLSSTQLNAQTDQVMAALQQGSFGGPGYPPPGYPPPGYAPQPQAGYAPPPQPGAPPPFNPGGPPPFTPGR